MTTQHACALVLTLTALSGALTAQDASPDERQIRALLRGQEQGRDAPRTADSIFWSGALARPKVGTEAPQVIPSGDEPGNRVTGSQKARITVRRIEVAQSKDMAYDFSDGELSFELKTGRHVSFPMSSLRVWKRVAGQWTIVAEFHHPHVEVTKR